ncbi:hypothetical protein DDI_0615 [Dickeya dianthicola RNS04.9]|nr:hypothetical protein DDI_0615 [Dickeya dianthicola RNS04.9]
MNLMFVGLSFSFFLFLYFPSFLYFSCCFIPFTHFFLASSHGRYLFV